MISQSMVDLIEKNADVLAKQWLKDVRKNVNTPFYHTYEQDRLYSTRLRDVQEPRRSGLTFKPRKSKRPNFTGNTAASAAREGFPSPELIYSFILFRRHLWLFILHAGFFDTAYDLLRALELNNRVILFFDRAMHNMAIGI